MDYSSRGKVIVPMLQLNFIIILSLRASASNLYLTFINIIFVILETEELQPDRLRDLYTEKNITSYHHVIPKTKPENKQNIFTKKKNGHKFLNPFRKNEYQDSSKEQVFSR